MQEKIYDEERIDKLIKKNIRSSLKFFLSTYSDLMIKALKNNITYKSLYEDYIDFSNSKISYRTYAKIISEFKANHIDKINETPKKIKTDNTVNPVVDNIENNTSTIEPEPKLIIEEKKLQEPIVNNAKKEDERPVTDKSILKEHVDFYKLDEETRVDIKNKLKELRASDKDYKFNKYELNFISEYKWYQKRGTVVDVQKDEKKFVWTAT